MARTMRTAEESGALAERYLPAAAFGICALCLLVMVPVTFVILSGAITGLEYAIPALGAALAVAMVALVVGDR